MGAGAYHAGGMLPATLVRDDKRGALPALTKPHRAPIYQAGVIALSGRVMKLPVTTSIAVVLAALAVSAPAAAQQKQPPATPAPRPPVVINDPSLYRPPPPPHERTYVGPAPTVAPPMERIPPVAPLSPPPAR
jgi:hypothetical protein